MDCPALILITAVVLWGAVALLLIALLIRETLDRWHARHQHGAHHPTDPAFHTVREITQRIHHERRLPPPRIITIHDRTTNAASTTITLPTAPQVTGPGRG